MFFNLNDDVKMSLKNNNEGREITIYVNEEKIDKRTVTNLSKKIKKELLNNHSIKVKYFKDMREIKMLANEGIVFLDKKKKYLNSYIKTIGKLHSFEEKKVKGKASGENLFLYKMVFFIRGKAISFEAIMFSKKKLNMDKEFNGYMLLEGIFEENRYSNNFRTKKELDLNYFNMNLNLKKYKKIEYENEIIEEQDEGRNVLHAHTLYSKNDAFISVEQLKEAFDKNVLDSFAITDHREIRAFAEFQPELKGTDYRVIPGLEAEVFDDLDENFNYETDIHVCNRYHMVLLLTSEDTMIDFKGKEVKVNEGIRAFNKLITDANLKYYSQPDKEYKAQQEADGEFKSSSKPIMSLKQILEYKKQGLLIIGSACIAGTIRKYFMLNNMEKFKKYFDIVDWVEIHPIHNEIFMIENIFFKDINSIEDIKRKNVELVNYCIEHNKPFVFGDDAHIISKKDRYKRSLFKLGEVSKFSSLVKPNILEKLPKEKQEENIRKIYEENSIEKQPFLHTKSEVIKELKQQGFKEDIIEQFFINENKISNKCVKLQDITLIPDITLMPTFPNINVKETIRQIAWDFAIKKWSKDGTKETIDKLIKDRLYLEIEALDKRDFEIIYYLAYFLVKKSLEKGFMVCSRGSVGSSLLAYCIGITENNPLKPHYFCNTCKKIEFVEGKTSGLDFKNKQCSCGSIMKGDGVGIEFSSFLGYKHDKMPDVDLV